MHDPQMTPMNADFYKTHQTAPFERDGFSGDPRGFDVICGNLRHLRIFPP
jgi:hypothetical protein